MCIWVEWRKPRGMLYIAFYSEILANNICEYIKTNVSQTYSTNDCYYHSVRHIKNVLDSYGSRTGLSDSKEVAYFIINSLNNCPNRNDRNCAFQWFQFLNLISVRFYFISNKRFLFFISLLEFRDAMHVHWFSSSMEPNLNMYISIKYQKKKRD